MATRRKRARIGRCHRAARAQKSGSAGKKKAAPSVIRGQNRRQEKRIGRARTAATGSTDCKAIVANRNAAAQELPKERTERLETDDPVAWYLPHAEGNRGKLADHRTNAYYHGLLRRSEPAKWRRVSLGDVRYAARGPTHVLAWGSTLKRIVAPADT